MTISVHTTDVKVACAPTSPSPPRPIFPRSPALTTPSCAPPRRPRLARSRVLSQSPRHRAPGRPILHCAAWPTSTLRRTSPTPRLTLAATPASLPCATCEPAPPAGRSPPASRPSATTPRIERAPLSAHSRTVLNRSAFATTVIELRLIATPANIGLSDHPKNGINTPAASGMPAVL